MKHDDSLPGQLTSLLDEEELTIFLFHGVVTSPTSGVRNYTGKHIHRELFAHCIGELAEVGTALSMDDVLSHMEHGVAFPDRAFAVTFDDGFENNVSVAAPILDDFSVPATIYVTTEFVDQNRMSWIDRIEEAVERVPNQALTLNWTNEIFLLEDTESRINFLKAVRTFVKTSPDIDANAFADHLCEQLAAEDFDQANGELDRKMSWDQVRTAANSPLLSIGGHSHTHATLSFLSPEELDGELDKCFGLLEEKGGIEPTHFSYPEGLEHCYSEAVIKALKQRGVRCSPTAMSGTNRVKDDLFHLSRFLVG